jgi:hypothetical protein
MFRGTSCLCPRIANQVCGMQVINGFIARGSAADARTSQNGNTRVAKKVGRHPDLPTPLQVNGQKRVEGGGGTYIFIGLETCNYYPVIITMQLEYAVIVTVLTFRV